VDLFLYMRSCSLKSRCWGYLGEARKTSSCPISLEIAMIANIIYRTIQIGSEVQYYKIELGVFSKVVGRMYPTTDAKDVVAVGQIR
jgi:hypothetical protein